MRITKKIFELVSRLQNKNDDEKKLFKSPETEKEAMNKLAQLDKQIHFLSNEVKKLNDSVKEMSENIVLNFTATEEILRTLEEVFFQPLNEDGQTEDGQYVIEYGSSVDPEDDFLGVSPTDEYDYDDEFGEFTRIDKNKLN